MIITNGVDYKEVSSAVEQAYNALDRASFRMGQNMLQWSKGKDRGKKRTYYLTEAHREVTQAMEDVLNNRITPEQAIGLLHTHDVLKQRIGD